MDLYLATQNKHKIEEINAILRAYQITVKMAPDCEKIEPKDWPIEKVAGENAKRLADASGKPTIVDDSGFFFSAYKDFPGSQARWCFEHLGYKGLLKLLKGENRSVVARCAAALCFPSKEPKVFISEMKGHILEKPADAPETEFPYERIFVIDGFSQPVCFLSREEKNKYSHRGNAFRKLGEFVQQLRL